MTDKRMFFSTEEVARRIVKAGEVALKKAMAGEYAEEGEPREDLDQYIQLISTDDQRDNDDVQMAIRYARDLCFRADEKNMGVLW